jgi:hypothetical protein
MTFGIDNGQFELVMGAGMANRTWNQKMNMSFPSFFTNQTFDTVCTSRHLAARGGLAS